jgi:hypothetical protein
MLAQIRANLTMTPAQRLESLMAELRVSASARLVVK